MANCPFLFSHDSNSDIVVNVIDNKIKNMDSKIYMMEQLILDFKQNLLDTLETKIDMFNRFIDNLKNKNIGVYDIINIEMSQKTLYYPNIIAHIFPAGLNADNPYISLQIKYIEAHGYTILTEDELTFNIKKFYISNEYNNQIYLLAVFKEELLTELHIELYKKLNGLHFKRDEMTSSRYHYYSNNILWKKKSE